MPQNFSSRILKVPGPRADECTMSQPNLEAYRAHRASLPQAYWSSRGQRIILGPQNGPFGLQRRLVTVEPWHGGWRALTAPQRVPNQEFGARVSAWFKTQDEAVDWAEGVSIWVFDVPVRGVSDVDRLFHSEPWSSWIPQRLTSGQPIEG